MIDSLYEDLKNAEDSTEATIVLLDYCFNGDDALTESQLSVLLNMFDYSHIASYALMYLYSEMTDVDLLSFAELYNVLYEKFSDKEVSVKMNSISA